MPYVTIMQSPRYHQISLDEFLSGKASFSQKPLGDGFLTSTLTRYFERVPQRLRDQFDYFAAMDAMDRFVSVHKSMLEAERRTLYMPPFFLPKKTGGLRQIDAPAPPLMSALYELKSIFETYFLALYHTSAYAYVAGRSAVDAVKKHQNNESKWFLKTDFSNFFGSTTEDFVFKMLSMIFPFSEVAEDELGRTLLKKCLSLCFLNGGLPQGTPISPMLTNLMMIPIDYRLFGTLREQNCVYTRYADDILISKRVNFDHKDIVSMIDRTLSEFGAPFKIKPEKTRYGSSAGQNWNLGVMLNKDNQITIGWRTKKRFKAMCHSYLEDKARGVQWDPHDSMRLLGLISYYKMVEKDYIQHVLDNVNKKHKTNIMKMLRDDMKNGGSAR